MSKQARLLQIRVLGDDILRIRAEEVNQIDDELKEFAEDLCLTMYARDGVGLAAPQVGVSRRIFVFDTQWTKGKKQKNPIVVINPVIESYEGEIVGEEGCISIPDIYAEVVRASKISYSYMDLDGNKHLKTAEDYEAIVFQHEYDHLEGVLFTDKISSLTKLKLKRKLKEIEKTAVNGVNIRDYSEE